MQNKIMDLALKIENVKIVSAIKRGLILLIPILILGSITVTLRSFPVPEYLKFIYTFSDGIIVKVLNAIYNATMGHLAGYLVLAVSYFYAKSINQSKDPIFLVSSMFTAFSCYVGLMYNFSGENTNAIFSASGIFIAMLASIGGVWLFSAFHKLFRLQINYYSSGSDEKFKNAVSSILPYSVCVLIFVGFNLLINFAFDVPNLNALFSKGMLALFSSINNDFLGGIVYLFMLNFAWFFGVHGANMMMPVLMNVYLPLNESSTSIVSQVFFDTFASIGGSGTTLCLTIAMLIFSKSKNNKKLAKSSIPFSIFNINEFLVFGLPVILNPVMLIPFVCVPIISYIIAYVFTAVGFMPIAEVAANTTWTTPALFSGYMIAGGIPGLIVQLIIIVCGVLIYAPFVMMADQIQEKNQEYQVIKLTELIKENQRMGRKESYIHRNDYIGEISKVLISELRADIENDRIPVYYQPIMNSDDDISSAEALLRWKFKGHFIYPPVIIELAHEDVCYEELTQAIIRRAVKDVKELTEKLGKRHTFSINISTDQLNSIDFVDGIIETVRREGIVDQICLEITEDHSLENMQNITDNVNRLYKESIGVYIDDFSMGSTSIKYLQKNSFKTVKLDGELVREMRENPRSINIVKSIVDLGHELGFDVVAEYVETQEIRDKLVDIGVKYLQGYLYSPALEIGDFISFARKLHDEEEPVAIKSE